MLNNDIPLLDELKIDELHGCLRRVCGAASCGMQRSETGYWDASRAATRVREQHMGNRALAFELANGNPASSTLTANGGTTCKQHRSLERKGIK